MKMKPLILLFVSALLTAEGTTPAREIEDADPAND